MSERKFTARTNYDANSWWALVHAEDATHAYWRSPKFTSAGARFSAWRMARKLNRLEARGKVA